MIIPVDRLKIEQLTAKFTNVKSFTRKELKEFYKIYDPELKETTFRWMLYDLKKRKIIVSIDRGLYSLVKYPTHNINRLLEKEKYKPSVSENLEKLYKSLKKRFPLLDICVWETSWLNEFMLHQPGKFFSIIEVESGAEETVFYFLKEDYNNIFLEPTRQELEWYIYNSNYSIVIKRLLTQAPVSHNLEPVTPKLEKILIDVFKERDFFYPYEGNELNNIFNYAFQYYQISLKTLFRYAGRRRCKESLKKYLQEICFDISDEGVF